MDDYDAKTEEKDSSAKRDKKSAPETQAAETQAAAAPPAKGPEFYRNPDGGRLTTTKPPDAE